MSVSWRNFQIKFDIDVAKRFILETNEYNTDWLYLLEFL